MSRRGKHKPKLDDDLIFRTIVAELANGEDGLLGRVALIHGCSAQHVANVRKRKSKEPLLGLFYRGVETTAHYVEPWANIPPPYPYRTMEYHITEGDFLLLDIMWVLAMLMIGLCLLFGMVDLRLMAIMVVMTLWCWHEVGSEGRRLRAAIAERHALAEETGNPYTPPSWVLVRVIVQEWRAYREERRQARDHPKGHSTRPDRRAGARTSRRSGQGKKGEVSRQKS